MLSSSSRQQPFWNQITNKWWLVSRELVNQDPNPKSTWPDVNYYSGSSLWFFFVLLIFKLAVTFASELWYKRRLFWVPWTSRRSNQSILKEISPECSLEGLILKLKLQYFGHLMRRADSLERSWCLERLRAGEEGDDRGWDGRMASPTQWTWVWVNSGSWWGTGRPGVLPFMGSQRVGHDWATELNWTFQIIKV